MVMTNKQIPRKLGITMILTLLLTTSTILIGQAPHANALVHSMSVAYVTDFGTGLCDTGGPGIGSSIFVNAINMAPGPFMGGPPPAGCPGGPITYTTGTSNGFGTVAGGNTVTFTNVSVSAINAGGVATLAPFDTVMLYEVCDIGSPANAPTMAAINSYLAAGGDHKLVILDGDRCSPLSAGSADYSGFLFPFTSSNPGPSGFSGSITFLESEAAPAVLTRSISTGFVGFPADAIGDSNTFTSNAGGWCAATMGSNGLGTTGIQTGYARTATGGLAIWNGWDNWFTFGPTALNAQMFDNILDQSFNPDKLPCGVPVTGIKLDPLTASNPAGGTHTVTATVTDSSGNPQAGITVTFTVTSGPNTGVTGTAVTDSTGHATFTYTDTGGAGTDTIVAHFTDSTGGIHTSNTANKIWTIVTRATSITTMSSQSGNDIPGTPVTDSATVTGSGPTPLPDLTGSISYQICGPNPSASTTLNCVAAGTVSITTPNAGTFTAASPSQSPTAPGSYCWTATYTPASGSSYTTSGSTTTTNECFNVLANFAQGRMTGGGSVTATTGTTTTKVTHGFELHCDATKSPNNLEVNWGSGNKFHLTSLTSAFCFNDPTFAPNPPVAGFDTYIGKGTGALNGVAGATASWTFTDAGEPGTNDHAIIVVKDSSGTTVLAVSGSLNHGNQQAHNN